MACPVKKNVVVVISDTLRSAYLGCYGNPDIRTPNIDRFAKSATVFTEAYPESLPTIPVRRALHTGRRAYPFRDYRAIPWDIVCLPGWQPMADAESTLAEDLAHAGYHTGFVTDTLPYFAPGMNFTRGFWQWEFTRGKQQDRWASVHAADPQRLAKILGANKTEDIYSLPRYHVANTDGRMTREECCTGRSFRWAMRFLEDNASLPFYLLVDVFDPHEPWEAPQEFYHLYADPLYDGPTCVHSPYTTVAKAGLGEAQLRDMTAHYSGLVTLVDYWFGQFLDKLDALGLTDATLVIFTSDHGTNFGDNSWNIIGKPGHALLPGTMHLPLIVRHPEGIGAGRRVDGLRYNIDITATVYDWMSVQPLQAIEGISLLSAIAGDRQIGRREYLTSRYGAHAWYRDERWWVICNVKGSEPHVYDLSVDPMLERDAAGTAQGQAAFQMAWGRLLADAGGKFPDYARKSCTDAIGEKPVQ